MAEAERRLKSLSTERTAEFQTAKRRLEDEREGVRRKITELERQLRELRATEERITRSITKEDERIAAAEEDLVHEKAQVQQERSAVQKQEQDVAAAEAALAAAEAELNASTASARAKVEELDEAAGEVKLHITEANLALRAMERVARKMERGLEGDTDGSGGSAGGELGQKPILALLGSALGAYLDTQEKLSSQRQNADDEASAMQSLAAAVLELQQKAKGLRKELDDMREQLPQLEAAKKLAASSRNFKEAARLAQEIKDLTSREADLTGELQATDTEHEEKAKALEDTKAKVEAEGGRAAEAEQKADRQLVDELLTIEQQLFRAHRRAVRRQFPTQCLLEADLQACRDVLAMVRQKHGWTSEEPSKVEAETEEEGSTDEDELEAGASTRSPPLAVGSLIVFDGDEEEAGSVSGQSVAEKEAKSARAGSTGQGVDLLVSSIADDLLDLDVGLRASASDLASEDGRSRTAGSQHHPEEGSATGGDTADLDSQAETAADGTGGSKRGEDADDEEDGEQAADAEQKASEAEGHEEHEEHEEPEQDQAEESAKNDGEEKPSGEDEQESPGANGNQGSNEPAGEADVTQDEAAAGDATDGAEAEAAAAAAKSAAAAAQAKANRIEELETQIASLDQMVEQLTDAEEYDDAEQAQERLDGLRAELMSLRDGQ